MRASTRDLPFAAAGFDAVISVGAFEYFGTDVHCAVRLARPAKPGGALAMSTVSIKRGPEGTEGIPAHIQEVVGAEALAWRTPRWWEFQWSSSPRLPNVEVRRQDGARHDWREWTVAVAEHDGRDPGTDPVLRMLDVDRGEGLGIVLATAIVT